MSLDQLLQDAKAIIASGMLDGKLEIADITRAAVGLAEKMNEFTNLSGSDKKKYVIHAVDAAVREVIPAGQYAEVESKFVQNVLPSLLDAVVAAARGRFALKKPSVSCFVGALQAMGCPVDLKKVFDPVKKVVAAVDAVLDDVVVVVPALSGVAAAVNAVEAAVEAAAAVEPAVNAVETSAPAAASEEPAPADATVTSEEPAPVGTLVLDVGGSAVDMSGAVVLDLAGAERPQ